MAKRVAVIDIGSNSVRMVVYEKTSRFSFHLLHEAKSKVRISEHAYQNDGNLQDVPMQRTFEALRDFLTISHSLKARKILCVATSALRDAPNKQIFIQRVRSELKLNIKIIDGIKESYYGAIACANLLPSQTNALSIDIGGGSTEFSIINQKEVSNTLSTKLGTVRLKELFFDKNDIKGAIKYIDKQLEALDDLLPTTLVGIGGTFRALSSAIMLQNSYPLKKLHAYEYPVETFKNFISSILEADEKTLTRLGIEDNRFDIIKPGSLILERVLKKIKFDKIITSGVGVREGVYLSDLLRNSKAKLPTNYNTSVRYLIDTHISNRAYSNQLSRLSKNLFDTTYKHLGIDEQYRYELAIAAKLYPIGASIHYYSTNKHSYTLIQNALEYGFTHKNILLIATLVKYAKKRLPPISHIQKYQELLPDEQTINALSYLMSITIALLSHRPQNIDFDLEFKDGILFIKSKESLYLSRDAIKKIETIENLKITFL